MRIPINLASQPPENLRPLRTGVLLLTVSMLILGTVILRREMRSRNEFRSLISRQDQLQESLRTLQSRQAELEAALSTPQAAQIRERSAFLNSLILRKGISWTQIFMDLEKTLPERAHVVSIRPNLNENEQVDLTLTVAADTVKPLVDFVKNLEASPQFSDAAVGAEHYASEKAASGEISLDVTARYHQDRSAPVAQNKGVENSGEAEYKLTFAAGSDVATAVKNGRKEAAR